MQLIATNSTKAIVGLGLTGLAVARWLQKQGQPFVLFDSRANPPLLGQVQAEFADCEIHTGELNVEQLQRFDEIVVSPGLDTNQAPFTQLRGQGLSLIGDIELFARELLDPEQSRPVIAISGSNGKSTVTDLMGEMVRACGLNAGVGGNLGVPALELLGQGADIYVLELSSYQLETLQSLKPAVAVVLNMSADHMDRYGTMINYHRAKHRIFQGAKAVVYNREDALTVPLLSESAPVLSFGGNAPDLGQYGLLTRGEEVWLAKGIEPLLNTAEMVLQGRHNWINALAALALGELAGLDQGTMLNVLTQYRGLPHRCELVAEKSLDEGVVRFINDSKGTNIGATLAAIEGLGNGRQNLLLLAGGQGKGQDFSELARGLGQHVREVFVYGADAREIAVALNSTTCVTRCADLAEATQKATAVAGAGDVVLLSPACASLDAYSSYIARGDHFRQLASELSGSAQ